MKRMMWTFVLMALLLPSLSATATTTIEWWQFWTDPDIKPTIKAMVNEFERANPDIKVKLTDLTWANGHEKIVIAFASGTGPDVVELGSDWIAEFADNKQIADVTDAITPDSGEFSGWGMATYKNRVYAYPWILGTRVLFGNRDLLKRAGVDSNFVPLKWRDMWGAAKEVNKLGDDIYGWGSNAPEKHRLYKKFMPFFWSFGGQIFTDDGKYCVFSSDYGLEAIHHYRLLHDSVGYVDTQRGIEDAFLDGKIGFIISGDWLLKRIAKEKRRIDLLTTLIPGPEYPGKSFMGGEFLAINSSVEGARREAAIKFIRFITSPENQLRFCKANMSANPSSKVAQADPYFENDPNLRVFIRQLRASKHPPVDPDWVEIEGIIEEAVEDALFGDRLYGEAFYRARQEISDLKGL